MLCSSIDDHSRDNLAAMENARKCRIIKGDGERCRRSKILTTKKYVASADEPPVRKLLCSLHWKKYQESPKKWEPMIMANEPEVGTFLNASCSAWLMKTVSDVY